MYLMLQPAFHSMFNPRLFASMGLAALVTFGIFVVMDKLTHFDGAIVEKPEAPPIIDLVFDHQDKPTPVRPRLPPIEPPQTKPKHQIPDIAPSDYGDSLGMQVKVNIPTTDITNDIGDMTQMDTGARPIVRMQPKYPNAAAQEGIEGWVKLIFSIDASGTVRDIEVVDAEPKRIFNKAARRALSKWKYKPQLVAGKPVAQEGLEVVLDFKLDNG